MAIVHTFVQKIMQKYQNGGNEEVRRALGLFDEATSAEAESSGSQEDARFYQMSTELAALRQVAVDARQQLMTAQSAIGAAQTGRLDAERTMALEMAHREVAERRLRDAWYIYGGGLLGGDEHSYETFLGELDGTYRNTHLQHADFVPGPPVNDGTE